MTGHATLAAGGRLRADGGVPSADQPAAAELERHPHRLTGEYWGEAAWLTGRVPAASWATVVEALERLG